LNCGCIDTTTHNIFSTVANPSNFSIHTTDKIEKDVMQKGNAHKQDLRDMGKNDEKVLKVLT